MTKFEIMRLNLEANTARILELLATENIDKQFNPAGWYCVNKDNAELRQRMRLLRKDTLKLDKILRGID